MAIRVVRLGGPRAKGEGVRLGTVRRPPRGVPRARWAKDNYYDAWLPELSPSPALVKRALAASSERELQAFRRRYRAEMKAPPAEHLLTALAALSKTADFSVGCYCADETRCHRAVLRELLLEHGARIAAAR
jgi:uncharacterized protein YeaO (DUF488 family)